MPTKRYIDASPFKFGNTEVYVEDNKKLGNLQYSYKYGGSVDIIYPEVSVSVKPQGISIRSTLRFKLGGIWWLQDFKLQRRNSQMNNGITLTELYITLNRFHKDVYLFYKDPVINNYMRRDHNQEDDANTSRPRIVEIEKYHEKQVTNKKSELTYNEEDLVPELT